jgi:hypothetical protein
MHSLFLLYIGHHQPSAQTTNETTPQTQIARHPTKINGNAHERQNNITTNKD